MADKRMSLRRDGPAGLLGLPEYILTSFFPGTIPPLLARHPRFLQLIGALVAVWYLSPVSRLQHIWFQVRQFILSTIIVSSEEDLFDYVVRWVSDRTTLRSDQSLVATSLTPRQVSDRRHRRRGSDAEIEENHHDGSAPKIKYEQTQGMQVFFYKKRIYFLNRADGEGHTYHEGRYRKVEQVSLSCLGRSTQPVKDLLEEVYRFYKDKEIRSLTVIRRPYTGSYSTKNTWSRITSKPRRRLETVILDADKKSEVIADVDEYMDTSTQAFYGEHGIPYRRGYLFYGPPGVGKTSLALALASRFNMDVYVLTLTDKEIGDSDLISLLNQLPGRSLLLLEDIDTAGLTRKGAKRRKRRGYDAILGESDDGNDDDEDGESSRVSLSGLLNAIDGVAAPEGHVLIMTTNKPHDLDDALVRAGRISVRVEFKNATKAQAEEIFVRMYRPSTTATFGDAGASSLADSPSGVTGKSAVAAPLTTTERSLADLAKSFANKIPDFEFSPADLQDFLLVHKKEPQRALEGLEAWMETVREDRAKKAKEKEEEKQARLRQKAERVLERAERAKRREEEAAEILADTTGSHMDEEGPQETEETAGDTAHAEVQDDSTPAEEGANSDA